MDLKVLLVEDDMINREVICRYLKNIYSVDAVENGDDALKLIKENKYDIRNFYYVGCYNKFKTLWLVFKWVFFNKK